MFKKYLILFFTVALLGGATLSFSEESAPVYDADNFPPQFDNQTENIESPPMASIANNYPSGGDATPKGVEQRLARAEHQINNLQHVDLTAKLDTLQTDVQTLRGQVEELTHQLETAQTQQRTMFADLDKRMSNVKGTLKNHPSGGLEEGAIKNNDLDALREEIAQLKHQVQQQAKTLSAFDTSQETITSTDKLTNPHKIKSKSNPTLLQPIEMASKNDQPNVAEEQQIYQTAYDLIKAKKYNDAIAALQKMLQKYPTGQFAANAHYWLGELYNLLDKKDQSAVEFSTVVKNYPDSPKVSDAQLKLGLIFVGQFKWPDAKVAFKKVVTRYPGTASARLAAEQIKQIRAAGH